MTGKPKHVTGNNFILHKALPFVGNCYVYLIVFANTFQYRPNFKYMPFCNFQFNYKYIKFLFSNMYLNPTLVGNCPQKQLGHPPYPSSVYEMHALAAAPHCLFVAGVGRGSRSVCGEDVATSHLRNRGQEAGSSEMRPRQCSLRDVESSASELVWGPSLVSHKQLEYFV